jgi:hypothetical protein
MRIPLGAIMTPGGFSSLALARYRALQVSKARLETRYVVTECGEYFVASDEDLDTFFVGIADKNILFCTADASECRLIGH